MAAMSKRLIGGFDPGKKGAFVTIDAFSGKLVSVHRVPLIKPKKPTVTTEIDWEGLAEDWGAAIVQCRRIYIEHIWGAAPAGKGRKDGGASTFKLGYAAGVPFGLILAEDIPYHFVTPQVWKGKLDYPKAPLVEKTAKDGTKSMEKVETWKEPSFDLARKFYPEAVEELTKGLQKPA